MYQCQFHSTEIINVRRKAIPFILGFLLLSVSFASADVVSFDDRSLASGSYWNGSDESAMFMSGDAVLTNGYNTTYGSWDGWAYSNMTDTTTPGYTNQFSAITGSGVNGSANYGVAYDAGGHHGKCLCRGRLADGFSQGNER